MVREEIPDPGAKPAPEDLPLNFCPVCSSRLVSRHSKMVCPSADGYFMSCSEFE